MKAGFLTKYLKLSDGEQIFFRFWQGKKDAPVLILLHGLGSHSLRYEEMASFFKKHSFNVYAFDFLGFGKSQAHKGHIEKFETYIKETLAMLNLAESEFPDSPKFIVGEDMGCIVGINFARYYQDYFDGLILLSPTVSLNMDILLNKKLEILFNTMFNKFHSYDVPFTNEMLTGDYKWQKRIQNDELDIKRVTGKFYITFMNAIKDAVRNAKHIELPVLVLGGSSDLIVKPEAIKDFFNRINSNDKQLNILDSCLHSLSIDKNRDIVYNIMLQWIESHLFFMNEFAKLEE